jgi:hypothetical protein
VVYTYSDLTLDQDCGLNVHYEEDDHIVFPFYSGLYFNGMQCENFMWPNSNMVYYIHGLKGQRRRRRRRRIPNNSSKYALVAEPRVKSSRERKKQNQAETIQILQ